MLNPYTYIWGKIHCWLVPPSVQAWRCSIILCLMWKQRLSALRLFFTSRSVRNGLIHIMCVSLRYTCQVVMGERHFPIMSADSRQEAREQAIKATMVLLLGEEERQMREEERQSAQVHTHSYSCTHTHLHTRTHTLTYTSSLMFTAVQQQQLLLLLTDAC